MKIFKLGELFAGAGGLAWGALHVEVESCKIIHAWANDCDAAACATYRKNICPDNVICCDVRELNFDALENIDALAFGFPCNNFSVVGKTGRLERQSSHWRRDSCHRFYCRPTREANPLRYRVTNVCCRQRSVFLFIFSLRGIKETIV